MRFNPHNMWQHGAIQEANTLRDLTMTTNLGNTPTVLLYLKDHQPCSSVSISEATGIPLASVGSIIGTGVRAKRLRFTLEKVDGQRRPVKFYSEVI